MALTNIYIGSVANDGTGNTLRLAFQTVNSNFEAVDTFLISQVTSTDLANAVALLETKVNHDADVLSLQNQIDDKAEITHTHIISNITGLQTALDAKASVSSLNSSISALNSTIAAQNLIIADLIDRIEVLENL